MSGCWLLALAGSISSRFDLPWINGLLSLIYLGVAAAVIVNVFRVKNPCVQVLIGALLVTFPCMVNTYFYGFAAIPFFACCFLFMSPNVFYHPLMLMSLSLLYIFFLLLAERYLKGRHGTAAALLLFSVLVCKFAVNANIFYHEMEICMERSLSMGTEMLTRVHLLDDGSVTKLMIVNYDSSSEILDPEEYGEIAFSATQLRAHLLYEGVYAQRYLDKILGCEYDVYYYDDELASSEAVSEMGTWPAADSVQVIGDVAVIKLPDSEMSYD